MLPGSFISSAITINFWNRREPRWNWPRTRRVTEEMVQRSRKRYVCAYEVATTYAGLRDRESAFAWLRKSLDERADCSPWIAADPKLDPLRSDPRFQDLLRRLGISVTSSR